MSAPLPRYPPTNPAVTTDLPSRPILSLIAINETSGNLVDPIITGEDPQLQTNTVYSVTFCRACPTGEDPAPPPNYKAGQTQLC